MKKYISILILILCSNFKLYSQEQYLGEIRMFAGNFPPKGWALCNGQILPINQNQALFSLLGTTYGGNGQSNFALPDFRGKVPVHFGQGPGLSDYSLGQTGGSETATISISQMPTHSHQVTAVTVEGNQNSPAGNLPANTKNLDKEYSTSAPDTTMNAAMIGYTGGGQAFSIKAPTNTVTFIIAITGIFPSRN